MISKFSGVYHFQKVAMAITVRSISKDVFGCLFESLYLVTLGKAKVAFFCFGLNSFYLIRFLHNPNLAVVFIYT